MRFLPFLIALSVCTARAEPAEVARCVPAGIRLSDIVEVITQSEPNAAPTKVTIAQKLSELGASCSDGNKLVDRAGREIVFFHLTGCWGLPPPNAAELLKKQRAELAALQERFTVVEMTCNSSGARIP